MDFECGWILIVHRINYIILLTRFNTINRVAKKHGNLELDNLSKKNLKF